jgi:hypothetical protein|tara:strand:+ start:135 stop:323 length:189 start_codon:yes stop_codon:yes gene_type:complete
MENTDYDKIVDKLMQFRGKLPKSGQVFDARAKLASKMMRDQVDDFILLIEEFAKLDSKGLIK